jgi:hypothetical protein
VLEVGAGTGASLPHYPRDAVAELVLRDPSPGMLARARAAIPGAVQRRLNQFRPRRHRLSANHYREIMHHRFGTWREVVGVATRP